MKVIWSIVALLVLAGLFVLLQPPRADSPGRAFDRAFTDSMEGAVTERPQAEPTPAPTATATSAPNSSTAPDTGVAPAAARASERPTTTIPTLDDDLDGAQSGAETATNPASSSTSARSAQSSTAPSPRSANTDDSTLFEPEIPAIPFAEILPSTFRKLPDGSISVDDAWTISGEGTDASPYEVSWEFLASAQDSYVPRLSENKIPARIAFLSGKRLRISGYLAFPLVAQTSGECLIMLNQWDGCCIGIPPTPYDAIEVKLAEPISGWRKHTYSFGSIEGTFTVDPYLVENWLVGLYMLKDATMKREL
jgi:hypothetical protein